MRAQTSLIDKNRTRAHIDSSESQSANDCAEERCSNDKKPARFDTGRYALIRLNKDMIV